MTPLHNEFLLNYCYRRDVPCQGSTKEMLGEGKIIFISRLAASPQPRRRVRCPPGSPTAAGGAGRGRRRAVPHRRLIRPSSLSAGSSQKKKPKKHFFGGKGARGSGERPASEGSTGAAAEVRPPRSPADGTCALRGRGDSVCGGVCDRGDPAGDTAPTSPLRIPRPAAALSSPPAPSHPLDPAPGGSSARGNRARRRQTAALR